MNNRFAVIVANALPVVSFFPAGEAQHAESITLSIPNGYDDVKKLSKKVLEFAGNKFAFTGWNSDTNHIYFKRAAYVARVSK